MARLTRYVMLLGTVLGLNVTAPAPVQAGVIPWMYDAIFGPVGSIRANQAAYRYGYGNGLAYSAYAPTTVAYAPVSMASYGGGGGCSTCSQTANYAPAYSYDSYYAGPSYANYGVAPVYGNAGCSTCNSCNTCSSCGTSGYFGGSTCSNCNVGSSPASANYGTIPSPSPITPIPESNNSADRMYRLENKVHDLQREMDKHFKRDANGTTGVNPNPYNDTNRLPESETVHGRRERSKSTFDSEAPDPFVGPRRGGAPGTPPIEDSDERESRKVDLAPPVTIPGEKPADEKVPEAVPQTLRLDSRVTTRAIAPRDRMPVSSKPVPASKSISQAKKKTTTSWLDSSLTSDVTRQ